MILLHNYLLYTEVTVDFKLVRGKCSVVFSEEFTPERDNLFLNGEDKFYFAEVYMCSMNLHFLVCSVNLAC